MIEKPRPNVMPKPEIWRLCETLAEKHNLTPFEVLERFVAIGAVIARVEEVGGTVTASAGMAKVDIKVFCEGKSSHQTKTP